MTFVVTEACIQCKYTDCVNVCPMNCFLEGPNFLVINPDECIDCSMCVAECPVGAIVSDREICDEQLPFVALNARMAKAPGWKPLTRSKAPMPEASQWSTVQHKRHLLEQ